jgi:arylsulfatase A-like enzyme
MPTARALAVVAVIATVGAGSSHGAGVAVADRPNFIFFQPDEMRAESVGCYGHPVVKTPNFDAFAAQGTRFDQAHVSYTVCSQSRVAFMTGWPSHVSGHRTLWSLLHDWEPNMLKYFKQSGYDVQWWGKNDLLAPDAFNASVTQASSHSGDNDGDNVAASPADPRYYSFLSTPTKMPTNGTADHNNVAAAIAYLQAHRRGVDPPFVIFLPLTKPHPPYSTSVEFYSSVDPAALPSLRPAGTGKPDFHALIRQYRNLTRLDDAFFRELHAVYLGSIEFSDFLFGLLLAAVDAAQLENSTTVALWADHGDYAGDYGLVEKWCVRACVQPGGR